MNQSARPAWLPNWDDDSAYPARWDDWTLGKWVWEFLRRNAAYQSDYAHFVSLPGFYPGGGKTPKWSGRSIADDEDMKYRYCEPPAMPGETSSGYWSRNKGNVAAEMALEERLIEKWGVTSLPDPADDNGYAIIGCSFELPPYVLDIYGPDLSGWIPPQPEPDERHHLTLRFDVRYGLSEQIEKALEMLTELRNSLESEDLFGDPDFHRISGNAVHLRKLPAYLRAFDASQIGIGPRELAWKICPEKRANEAGLRSADEDARRAIKEGKKLVSGGYLDLLLFK